MSSVNDSKQKDSKQNDNVIKPGLWCILFKDKTNGKPHSQVMTIMAEIPRNQIDKDGFDIISIERVKKLKRREYKK